MLQGLADCPWSPDRGTGMLLRDRPLCLPCHPAAGDTEGQAAG